MISLSRTQEERKYITGAIFRTFFFAPRAAASRLRTKKGGKERIKEGFDETKTAFCFCRFF